MTSEEIRAAIERLGAYCNSTYDVMLAFMNYGNSADYGCTEFKGVLLELLKQADPDTHMELPIDRDGEVIRVGDELCNDVISAYLKLDERLTVCGFTYSSHGWMWQDEFDDWHECEYWRHYRKPTVEEMLTDYAKKLLAWHNDCDPSDSADDELALVVEYADKLREVMADDDAR